MINKFDELTRSLAQSVTRRGALKQFGIGLAGMALACFGLTNKARAATVNGYCMAANEKWIPHRFHYTGICIADHPSPWCETGASAVCQGQAHEYALAASPCGALWDTRKKCSF